MKKIPLSRYLYELDKRYGFGKIENALSCNWFNPFATLWLNIRSFPIRQAIKFPVIVYGRPRFYSLIGKMIVEGKVSPGMIKFNQCKPGAPSLMSVQSELLNAGTIIFKGRGFIGTGDKIRIAQRATLELGANFKITDMCNIGCFTKIVVGEQSRITHRCQILDSNYHYVANFNKRIIPKWKKTIVIGKGCWICNSSTVTGGAILPDFTIVASNSLVGKDFTSIPVSSMIGGIPAKLIATGFRRVENPIFNKEINIFYAANPEDIFSMPSNYNEDNVSSLKNTSISDTSDDV